MGFCAFPFFPSNISSSFSFRQLTVNAVLGKFISAVLGVFFAVGIITGAVLGQEIECGCIRGAVIGAVSGAFLSIEVFEDFLRLWESNENWTQCLLYLGGFLVSVFNGRLLRERVGPLFIFNTGQIQVAVTEENSEDIFETGKSARSLTDVVDRIPIVVITTKNHAEHWGESSSCAVCIQDFQLGEKARQLPYCGHMFHATCIDQWLVRRGCCPLCRRDI